MDKVRGLGIMEMHMKVNMSMGLLKERGSSCTLMVSCTRAILKMTLLAAMELSHKTMALSGLETFKTILSKGRVKRS